MATTDRVPVIVQHFSFIGIQECIGVSYNLDSPQIAPIFWLVVID